MYTRFIRLLSRPHVLTFTQRLHAPDIQCGFAMSSFPREGCLIPVEKCFPRQGRHCLTSCFPVDRFRDGGYMIARTQMVWLYLNAPPKRQVSELHPGAYILLRSLCGGGGAYTTVARSDRNSSGQSSRNFTPHSAIYRLDGVGTYHAGVAGRSIQLVSRVPVEVQLVGSNRA